jgi:N,N'-diacetyllegionaminate synthase
MINQPFEIIAETAFSHEGEYEYLKSQVKSAVKAEVDFIKFQVFLDRDSSYPKNHPGYNKVPNRMFDQGQWSEIFQIAFDSGLKIIALPLNIPSLEFCLNKLSQIEAIEIHSICFNEHPLISMLVGYEKKVFLGVGGRYLPEIRHFIDTTNIKSKNIYMMVGFQSFPTLIEESNLCKIRSYKDIFADSIIGYADHSTWKNEVFHKMNDYAYLLGARIFEKHIVVEKGVSRIDYESGIEINDFLLMRQNINSLIETLGSDDMNKLNSKELIYRNREKRIVAIKNISRGEVYNHNNVGYRISQEYSTLEQGDYLRIIGKIATKDIPKDYVISADQIE